MIVSPPRLNCLHDIDAVIFAGGFGTRLQGVLRDRPKPLAIVGEKPFLAWLLDWLAAAGVRRATLCTGYLAEMIEAELGSQHGSVALQYVRETQPRGTGGALMDALAHTTSQTVLALNGDSLCLADLNDFVAAHGRLGSPASLLLTQVDDVSRYGQVEIDRAGRVRQFVEKGGTPRSGWINAGVYLLDRDVLNCYAGREGLVSLEREIFPDLIDQAKLLGIQAANSRFIDIGTPETLAAAESFLKSSGLVNALNVGQRSDRPAVFLDRDGTLIAERHYLSRPEQVELLPGAAEGVRRMNEAGLRVFLASNQSGVGRGYFSLEQLGAVHDRMTELLRAEGARLDAIYVCPHHPDETCDCRKPAPGMIEQAVREYGVSPQHSFVVGDKPCDIDLGAGVGATTILVRTGYGAQYEQDPACRPRFVGDDLRAAADYIILTIQARGSH